MYVNTVNPGGRIEGGICISDAIRARPILAMEVLLYLASLHFVAVKD